MRKTCKILFFQLLVIFMLMFIFQPILAYATKVERDNFTPNDEKIPLLSNTISKDERDDIVSDNTNKHKQLEIDSNAESFDISALFFFQGGVGLTFMRLSTTQSNQINATVVPTVSASIGYNQLFRFGYISSGIKIMIAYELGLAPSGNSTVVYKSNSAYGIIYVGYGRFLPYLGAGYTIMDTGQSFSTSLAADNRFSGNDFSFITGLGVNIDKHSGIDVSLRFHRLLGNYPNIFASYEFRF
ncbi:hypothetical protein LS73_004775 [Helicobacter muridarum]|uniref:Outer membrane protein beta-barrel domain-containing protein n=1 Tax=Helicobacter muridarum TaxID=216 RepID=A0A099U0V7_9HELI|nr:hypothetical protein [Helicobacter muridarum]TLE00499.1 hypothetical protein LS73_004775 [Helicobacter muridarum]STQ86474.1 Uncharacterised protein [Helicobacter muridarum]